MKHFRLIFSVCAAFAATSPALAQNQIPGTVPSVSAIVASLTPASAGPIVRSMSQSGNLPFTAGQYIPEGFDFPSYSVSVDFQEDGHLLSTEGMTTLRSLAVALSDPKLQGASLQVGVHVPFNNGLGATPVSARRAQAVVEHLTTFYNIPEGRLVPFGYGNQKLIDQSNPHNPVNERVEIINVSALK